MIVLAVGFTAVFTWWRGPLDGIQGRFDGAAYNVEGAVPTAFAVFAFALGTLAGALARRTILAMALTFLGYWIVWLPVGCRNSFMQLVGGTRGADRRADPAGAHGADPR